MSIIHFIADLLRGVGTKTAKRRKYEAEVDEYLARLRSTFTPPLDDEVCPYEALKCK